MPNEAQTNDSLSTEASSPAGEDLPAIAPDTAEELLGEEIDNIIPTRGYQMLPMVGIGGSAGSIGPMQEFFKSLPDDTGMVFVVILHLAPEYESALPQLLQRCTAMSVVQAEHGVKVDANRVYVIPPGKMLSSLDGQLRLAPMQRDRGRRMAVDLFFRTLADTHGPHASAIILSGMDGDGAIGIKRIKERGGLTIAQDPDEAEHPGMPGTAIATGMVDWVLPIKEMAGRLQRYHEHESRLRLPSEEGPQPGEAKALPADSEAELAEILRFLKTRTSRDFSYYKRATIVRRIGRRMQVAGVDDMAAYLSHLRSQPGEAGALLQDLLISVTNFFRDRDCFQALERRIPELFQGKGATDSIRVWVPACATGEEAYSLAILLCEHAREMEAPPAIQIFATDLDEDVIQEAREAIYPGTITADVSDARLARYFVKDHAGYRIRREIRELVLFAVHDLLKDSPFSRLDLVSCRNLLIYLNRDAQTRALDIFNFALNTGGMLFLGSSESVDDDSSMFSVLDKKNRIFKQVAVGRVSLPLSSGPGTVARALELQERLRESVSMATMVSVAPVNGGTVTLRSAPVPSGTNLSWSELHYKTLEHLGPPSVIVDENHEILHLSENVGRYLKFGGGNVSTNLVRAVHPALRLELRAALYRAAESDGPVVTTPVPVKLEGGRLLVRLRVIPQNQAQYLVVMFDAEEASSEIVEFPAQPVEPVVQHLERELEETKSYLRDSVEEYEASTEELNASNEELQAINEELRSATEELETGREELQSINEELTTVNTELKSNVDELARANSDLQNLMGANAIATVFLDRQLRITRFTPSAGPLFRLTPRDIGRSLTDFHHRLQYPGFADDANRVLQHLAPAERELKDEEGRIYLSRLLPYRTTEERIAGVVISCVDVTERRKAEIALIESNARNAEQFRRAIEEAPVPVIMQADDGQVLAISKKWTALTGYSKEETSHFEAWLNQAHANGHEVRRQVQRLFAGESMTEQAELEIITASGEHRQWDFSASIIGTLPDGRRFMVGMALDITDRKRAEDALKASTMEAQNARAESEAALAARDDFLAALSHELRTPLNPVLMTAADLEMDESLPPEVREQHTMIRRNIELEARLIDDLLDVTRISRGMALIDPVCVDVHDLLGRAAQMVLPDMQSSEVELKFQLEAEEHHVSGDSARLQQVFWNLLKNAFKFTEGRGLVTLKTSNPSPGRIAIAVIDTGIGIGSSTLERIFRPFDQGNLHGRHQFGGLGLGLTISKALVELHGGELRVASDGDGKGATFTVQLGTVPLPDKERNHDGPDETAKPPPSRLLVVEDHKATLAAMVRVLTNDGHDVFPAGTIKEALSLAAKEPCDLLISDLGLPDGSGLDLMREIKRRHGWVGIALSGYGMPSDVQESHEAGFVVHLNKPVSINSLRHAIRKARATVAP